MTPFRHPCVVPRVAFLPSQVYSHSQPKKETACVCRTKATAFEKSNIAVCNRWKEAGMIQSCAPKNNDDWYWLYAAVYIGGSVLVLTNDEMRDHHFSMLSHRSFERWKERHQVLQLLTRCAIVPLVAIEPYLWTHLACSRFVYPLVLAGVSRCNFEQQSSALAVRPLDKEKRQEAG